MRGASGSSSQSNLNWLKVENGNLLAFYQHLLFFYHSVMRLCSKPKQDPSNIVVVAFVCRSDHSQHPVCLPHEDQEGVALLCSHPPPAGQILHCPSRHPVNCQHLLHGTDGSRNHRLPPLTSLPAVSSGEGCLFPAGAHGGTLLWPPIIKSHFSENVWINFIFILGFL